MIISQTPLRISFVGGGSDLEEYWKLSPGKVISSTIDKYIFVIVKGRFDDKIYLNYSNKEIVESVRDIKHDLIREAMIKTGVNKSVEITTLADIPSEGSGLGSSSSVIVGLLHALYAYKGVLVTSDQLAKEACEIEIDILGKPIGKQDQYTVAHGGLNNFIFNPNGSVSKKKIILSNHGTRILGSNLLLFYTDINRSSSSILIDQRSQTQKKRKHLEKMVELVDEFERSIKSPSSFQKVGKLLNRNWQEKKKLSKRITNKTIDDMYSLAIKNGALGGKISGAGGGGFLLLFVPRERQNELREALKKYRELLNLGFHDIFRLLNKDKQEFSFWDYMSGAWPKNHGMRIDHFLVSNNLLNDVKSININKKPRSDIKPSDHTPIELMI